ncbi:radical SAM protein [Thermoplasmatales archaeon SG8-52-2]|nr:MAG: radical SAM protein [Thermoplasmatales archaeon SG8-52-2]
MKDIKYLLSNYFEILDKKRKAKFLLSKQVEVSFDKNDTSKILWEIHDKSIKNFKISDKKPKKSLLSLKIELAKRVFKNCSFCERRCNVDRIKKAGNCGVKEPGITSEFLHTGEERVLVPSHTIFFSGCTFHCVFCQNWDISQDSCGIFVEPEKLVEVIKFRNSQGSRNVNWVGGDPTPNLFYILEVLDVLKDNITQIWNSNMYCSSETMKLLSGIVDLYLTDFKYGNDDCARRLSKVNNYLNIIKRNHKFAHDSAEMIIRHLVMPNHVECCSKPIIEWISKNLPNACVNIMAQYRPEYHASDYDDISRNVSIEEYMQVKNYADKLQINQI